MNERIQELAQQCTYEYDDDFGKPHNDFDYEKFAELIVRQCASIAFDEYAATSGESSGESAILKHFGVEE
jgi:hypothetical protein